MRLTLWTVLLLAFSACASPATEDPGPGVPLELAEQRAATFSEVTYNLSLAIPEERSEPIEGEITVGFTRTGQGPLTLDFVPGTVQEVSTPAGQAAYRIANEHVVVDLPAEADQVTLRFTASDGSLNRSEEYLYALFVPDRARMSLPVMDQPDLKGRWTLSLEIPAEWSGVSNGAVVADWTADGRRYLEFAETKPIPTYLFAFAAGLFQSETAERNGRTMTMYHRESDSRKVDRNRDAIFDLHATSLAWLEDYTGIPYPFDKFDFVLVPSFQFGGMEHPGAIYYRATSLMLDPDPPQSRLLGRASLIAHETAHMWFGDLVTMKWFNDVWTKEVFANFMAAKMVEPSFPEVDHELRFLLSHYPSAYGVDRTEGANAIRQDLENLNQAGSLYGAIIYQKAPIVMRKLETLVGPESFRAGMQEYLKTFSYGNATWPDLIRILDARSDRDLASWSKAWVEEPGRPVVDVQIVDGRLDLRESDPRGRGLTWPQEHTLRIGAVRAVPGDLVPQGHAFILPNAEGLGYAQYRLPDAEVVRLLDAVGSLEAPVDRGAAWITLQDAVLEGQLDPGRFMEAASAALPQEPVELVRQQISGLIRSAYWRLLPPQDRMAWAPRLEILFDSMREGAESAGERNAWFSAWRDVVLSDEGIARMASIWREESPPPGVSLSEWDYAELARELALRDVANADSVLEQQEKRLADPDRRQRFEASMAAASPDPERRAGWFHGLAALHNRAVESQVLEGVGMLNHPLRARVSEQHLAQALDLTLEIQQTGDIFFPGRWLDAALGGHQTESATAIVQAFIDGLPADYPEKLKGKVLQSADGVFRAALISGQ